MIAAVDIFGYMSYILSLGFARLFAVKLRFTVVLLDLCGYAAALLLATETAAKPRKRYRVQPEKHSFSANRMAQPLMPATLRPTVGL